MIVEIYSFITSNFQFHVNLEKASKSVILLCSPLFQIMSLVNYSAHSPYYFHDIIYPCFFELCIKVAFLTSDLFSKIEGMHSAPLLARYVSPDCLSVLSESSVPLSITQDRKMLPESSISFFDAVPMPFCQQLIF